MKRKGDLVRLEALLNSFSLAVGQNLQHWRITNIYVQSLSTLS